MLNPKAQRLGMFGRGPGPFAAPELPTARFEPVAAPSPMMQPQRAQRPSTGRMIAGHIGDALMAMNGLRPMFGPAMQEQRQMQLRQQMAEAERMAPQRLTINGNLVEYDPSTGSTRTLFSAPDRPQSFEDNSGNRWEMDPQTGQPRMVFYDPTPRFDSNVTFNDRGEQVLVRTPRPNGFNPDGTPRVSGAPAPASALPPGYTIRPRNGGGGQPTGQRPFDGSGMVGITMQAESGGRRYGTNGQLLRSPAGAMGEMQVMPETARDPGFGIRPWDGRSPDDLARVGRDYLAAMRQRYNNDPAMIWAAYNAGPGRVDEARRRYGRNWLQAMPAETQTYVARNMRALGAR